MTLNQLLDQAVAGAAVLDPQGRASDAQLARTLGVTRSMVYRWRQWAQPRECNLARLRLLAKLHTEAAAVKAAAAARLRAMATQAASDLQRAA